MPPRLRTDLIVAPADEQGISCVEVTDPVTSIGFRFYDFEYALAQQLTGQPLEAVLAWVSENYGIEVTGEVLDQFLEKLSGLGFLVDGATLSEPVVTDSSSRVFRSEAPEPPAADIVPIPPFPRADAIVRFVGGPSLAEAEAPARPIAGHDDHRLKNGGSGPSDLGQPEQRERPDPGDESPGEGQDRGTGDSREVEGVVPRLEALAAPLPPALATRATPPASPAVPAIQNLAPAKAQTTAREGHSPVETPLASIAHAIISESRGMAPLGALDAAIASEGSAAGGVAPLGPPDGPGGFIADSWAGDLDKEVAEPRAERRQPPRPELVVMPAMAEPSRAIPVPRSRSWALLVVLVLLVAAGAAVWFLRPIVTPPAPNVSVPVPTVHVLSPQPTTFYRWFDTVGIVLPGQDGTLGFPTAGRVQDAMPPGTTFTAGETVARLQGASARELIVNRLRSRVAYYEQLRDSSRADGSALAVRQAEIKLAARRQELAAAQAALKELEIHPKIAGEIAELLVAKNALVKAGAPVFRVRAAGPRAIFPLSADDVSRARALGFCRVESIAKTGDGADSGAAETGTRAIDCTPSAPGAAGETRLAVDLVGATVVAPGTQVRLASARYDGVFPVPRSALVQEGGTDRLWIASGGRQLAESRVVEIAATIDELGLVARGIAVGDAVIVDPPADLKNGAEIRVDR